MVIWPVLTGTGKTADLVLACFGWFRSQRVKLLLPANDDTSICGDPGGVSSFSQ